jgi:hypothetical protein
MDINVITMTTTASIMLDLQYGLGRQAPITIMFMLLLPAAGSISLLVASILVQVL